MNIIRQQQAKDKELQTTVSQKAVQETSQAGAKANQQAMAIVENTSAIVTASAQTSVVNQAVQNIQPATTPTVSVQQERPTQLVAPTRYELPGLDKEITTLSNMSMGVVNYSIQNVRQEQKTFTTESENVIQQNSSLLTRGNPINDIINKLPDFTNNEQEQKVETVNRNVQSNELAGGVDITAMAMLPKGFDGYTNLAMKDTSFYKIEEIYKNQNTVDNARALRQLSSDRLHQEMINLQYRGQNDRRN
jgi:hypothetical protein